MLRLRESMYQNCLSSNVVSSSNPTNASSAPRQSIAASGCSRWPICRQGPARKPPLVLRFLPALSAVIEKHILRRVPQPARPQELRAGPPEQDAAVQAGVERRAFLRHHPLHGGLQKRPGLPDRQSAAEDRDVRRRGEKFFLRAGLRANVYLASHRAVSLTAPDSSSSVTGLIAGGRGRRMRGRGRCYALRPLTTR